MSSRVMEITTVRHSHHQPCDGVWVLAGIREPTSASYWEPLASPAGTRPSKRHLMDVWWNAETMKPQSFLQMLASLTT